MERKGAWDKALCVLRDKDSQGTLSSRERTLLKVLDEKNSPLYISDFLEDCSDFKLLIRDLID